MTYLILIILILLPIGINALLAFKFNIHHNLTIYYIIEAIIVLASSSIGHLYFYNTYNLNVLPSEEEISMAIGIPLLFSLVLYIGAFFRKLFTNKDRITFRTTILIFLVMSFFIISIIPLIDKYNYAKRFNVMENLFETQDPARVQTINGLTIAFVESSRKRHVRRQSSHRSNLYNNFFYIKNNNNTTYQGQILVETYDEFNSLSNLKILDNIVIEPGDIKLLVTEEDNIIFNEWTERSFKTDDEVHYFKAQIIQD